MKLRPNVLAQCLGVAVLISLSPTGLRGQAVANAQISGSVLDPSGAGIPGATVTATQTNTGLVRNAVSASDGNYVLPNLPVGPYKLDVRAGGFSPYEQAGIILQVSNEVTINVKLRLGTLTQQIVQVNANATMVTTQATSVSQVVGYQQVNELPLNGRQATQLILLSGFSTALPPNDVGGHDLTSSKTYGSSDIQGSSSISVAGGQANGTNYLMDGGYNTNSFSNVNLPFPFPDAIQEFSVQTNGLSARYGVHPGAQVNVVTKSGTNQFHGDLFEFVRNGDFDARNFFAATQDTLRRNQFGGTVGGPIRKDKLFFFFGYQGTRIRTAPPQTVSYVPTEAALSGNFSQLESGACQSSGVARKIVNPTTGQPFPGDYVAPTQFNPQAINLLKYIPLSNNPCGKLVYGIPSPEDEDQYIGRVDWNVSTRNSLFGRYFISDLNNPPEYGGNLLLTTRAGVNDRSQSMVLGDNYTITPNALNSIRATWTRSRIDRGPASDDINPATVGINIYSPIPNFIDLTVNGDFNVGCGTCAPGIFNTNTLQLADDVDIILGRHHLSFGGDWIYNQLNESNQPYSNGEFGFAGQITGDPLLDFLLGDPSGAGSSYGFTQGNPNLQNWRQNYIGVYAQDDIKVNSRLNFHVGLRWEPFLPEVDTLGRGDHFSSAAFAAGQKTSQYVNAPPGIFFAGDPGIPPGYAYHKLADFEPRVGLVWDPTGSGKQTIQASYSTFYDLPEAFYGDHFADSPPWGSEINITNPGSLTNPYVAYPGGDPFPLAFPPTSSAPFVPFAVYISYPLNIHPTSVQQWNLGYQRQLGSNWLISATYMGNHTSHLWVQTEANPAVYIPGTCNGALCSTTANTNTRRTLYLENPAAGSYYSNIPTLDDGANAEYNGLLLSAHHRFSANYTVIANYTYSHCISDGDFGQELGAASYQDPYNRNADRGNCDFDLRHNLNVSLVILSPKFKGTWTNRILGNWQLAPIISVHSGFWFTPLTGVDNSLTGVGLDRPNAISNPYVESTTGTLEWINPAAFVPNARGTFGNAGRDSLVGPGYFDVDAELSRFFVIREPQKLELRFEFFNLFNNVNFYNPIQTENSSSFGRIQQADDPRILELAMKYYF